MADAYLGSWLLLPELCLYEFGPMPASGSYCIAERGDEVHVTIEWSMGDGALQQTEYAAPPDGKPLAIDAPGVDRFALERIDARTLDSSAWAGDERIAWARRVCSHDGQTLAVVMQGATPDGAGFRNFQVYRRDE